ncbi:MAG: membrane protein insertion efficiency factor YidD [Bacteroidales bacterium]|nr:membrane protein insertion efficiency factor YidD [Bacteroidales bacterium]
MRKLLISPLIGLIYLYKYVISPVLPGGCRHFPTCSTYAIDALRIHGLIRGSYMAAGRIARCHPWGTHGYDPVPHYLIKKINLKKINKERIRRIPSCDRLKPQ